jgi:two-component sensor histidine kinase
MREIVGTGNAPGVPAFLSHGGDLGRLIADYRWERTAVGPIDVWPSYLRSTLSFMLSSKVPLALLWGEDGIMFYNSGYAEIAGARHPSILGSKVLDSWPEAASFNSHVLETGLRGETLSFEDMHFVLMRNGVAEDVWLDLDYSPIFDEAGMPAGVLAVVHETTRRHFAEAEAELNRERLSHALNAAGVIGIWDWHLATGQMFADERFAAFYSVDGERARHGAPRSEFTAAIHPEDREPVEEEIRHAIETGGDIALEHRLLHSDGSIRWVMIRGTAFRDGSGRAVRVSGAAVDVSDRRASEEKRRLLVRELHHRIKNTFAIIGGMVTMTARTARTVDEMAGVLRGRLVALASAHELIRPAITAELDQIEQTTFADLFQAILSPHLLRPEQLTIEAPEVEVGVVAATSLALVLHELATNSSKYGSLSTAEGTLTIRGSQVGENLRLDWVEAGGPPVSGPPRYQGFGSRLASMSIAGQLGGELEFHWQESGLHVVMLIPMERITR